MIDLYEYEKELYQQGFKYIGGIDESGRGPIVGPVVAACVVLPTDFTCDGLTDSKKLSAKKRDLFYDIIIERAIGVGIGIVEAATIDKINIYEATKKAMRMALDNTKCQVDYVLIDAMKLDLTIPSEAIIKGDSKSISIAAASVIAKVTRDRLMVKLDQQYPQYNFKKHKGYPTKENLRLLKEYGVIKEHRLSYKPVQEVLKKD